MNDDAKKAANPMLRPPAGSKDVTSDASSLMFIGAEAFRPKLSRCELSEVDQAKMAALTPAQRAVALAVS
jgi:hypothetical protein